ncbi:hypothetical protein PsAD2_00434 [Pseudovibrio axinellae]|uniref:Uncharacterized protein n=1 Tax=Pseudovibrio axinellae TaxID=989403 RepID=A0A161V870_9HYPH|nr:hypothetical protein [Pseudovibrio axinellae]KZL21149.1 hypothetical protein PsAD2_00434 [Pseudovibrio axinellae]SEQ89414.1 hypothetical protein SAMN05421798_10538 [Pseudovibrio axinellae]
MNFLKVSLIALTVCATTTILPTDTSAAENTSKLFSKTVETATYKQGISAIALQARQNPADSEAVFALGALQFLNALEGLQHDLYRYGAGNADIDRNLRSFLPILRIPVSPNPSPEPITYEKTREIFKTFVAGMEQANQTLAALPDKPVKLPVDLLKISLDADRSGTIEPYENLATVLGSLSRSRNFKVEGEAQSFPVTFDQADAKWLQGYSNLLMSTANFLLAFDFEPTYDLAFHSVFGPSATNYGKLLEEKGKRKTGRDFETIAAALNFVHSVNWQVDEPDRLEATRQNLLKVMQLNYETWDLVSKETDDDNEWLPNPNQTSPFQALPVTQPTIDAWLQNVKAAEHVLNGDLLIPSMSFEGGINMKTFFQTAQTFDIVLFITGPNSADYIEDGEVSDGNFMRTITRPMGRNFGSFAIWFN